MRDHTFGHHADSKKGGLPAAFYATKRAILRIAAPLAPFSSACCTSKSEKPLAALLEARFSSSPQQKAVKAPTRGI